jgi:hypothetical protein
MYAVEGNKSSQRRQKTPHFKSSYWQRLITQLRPVYSMENKAYKSEWCLLQNQFDSYEKHSLFIKLTGIIVLLAAEISDSISIYVALILCVMWLQDAIWKTFQSRIETRLLHVENCIANESEGHAFQFNSKYQSTRLSGLALVAEYVRQSLRPTVAFPYVALILMVLVHCVLQ